MFAQSADKTLVFLWAVFAVIHALTTYWHQNPIGIVIAAFITGSYSFSHLYVSSQHGRVAIGTRILCITAKSDSTYTFGHSRHLILSLHVSGAHLRHCLILMSALMPAFWLKMNQVLD